MASYDKSSHLKALHDSLLAEVARGSKDPTLPARIRAAIELNKKSMQEGEVEAQNLRSQLADIDRAIIRLERSLEKDKEN